jgi:hypothetical protein
VALVWAPFWVPCVEYCNRLCPSPSTSMTITIPWASVVIGTGVSDNGIFPPYQLEGMGGYEEGVGVGSAPF